MELFSSKGGTLQFQRRNFSVPTEELFSSKGGKLVFQWWKIYYLLPLHSMNEREIEATDQAEDNKRTQDLRMQPIPKLLLQYAIPAVVGTVVQALYNIVDTIFIGQVVAS